MEDGTPLCRLGALAIGYWLLAMPNAFRKFIVGAEE